MKIFMGYVNVTTESWYLISLRTTYYYIQYFLKIQ